MKTLLFTINCSNSTYPPLGLYSLVGYFEKKHPVVDIDFNVTYYKKFNEFKLLKRIAAEKPDLIGISCFVWNIRTILSVCQKIKSLYPKIQIVLGGPQISFKDEELIQLIKDRQVDYLIFGEGEYTFSQLLIHLEGNLTERFEQIPGLMGRKMDGNIFANLRAEECQVDLNQLPNPYLIHPEMLNQTEIEEMTVYVESSRGCPYQCSYCVGSYLDFTYKDVQIFLEELQQLARLGIKHVCILDGTLNFNIQRTKNMLRRIVELNLGMQFDFELKIELLDDELIQLLKEAGMKKMEVGLQSSNEETLHVIKRYHDRTKFIANMTKLAKSGFEIMVDIIIGLPYETIQDWYNSVDFCYGCGNVEIIGITLKLLPNTPLFDQRQKYGYQYDPNRTNRLISSSTMSRDMVQLAEEMAKMLYVIWSKAEVKELQPYVREICQRYYRDSFSEMLKDFTDFASENKISSQIINLSSEKTKMLLEYFINERFGEGKESYAENH